MSKSGMLRPETWYSYWAGKEKWKDVSWGSIKMLENEVAERAVETLSS
jgi:hypothetical protein